jgi:hypothetical protein
MPREAPPSGYAGSSFQAAHHIASSLRLFVPNSLMVYHRSFSPEGSARDIFLWLGIFSLCTVPTTTTAPSLCALVLSSILIPFFSHVPSRALLSVHSFPQIVAMACWVSPQHDRNWLLFVCRCYSFPSLTKKRNKFLAQGILFLYRFLDHGGGSS